MLLLLHLYTKLCIMLVIECDVTCTTAGGNRQPRHGDRHSPSMQ